jgi:hypothetical protein
MSMLILLQILSNFISVSGGSMVCKGMDFIKLIIHVGHLVCWGHNSICMIYGMEYDLGEYGFLVEVFG